MTNSLLSPGFRYLVVTPDGKTSLLDAEQIAAGDEGHLCGQIQSLVGWIVSQTVLDTAVGPVLVVQDGESASDPHLVDNPLARKLIVALGGADRRCGGMVVFCAAGPCQEWIGLSGEQARLLDGLVRCAQPHATS